MIEMNYEKLLDALLKVVPVRWDKVVLYSEYTPASYSIKFFVKIDGRYIDCFDLNGLNEDKLIEEFVKIDAIIRPSRKCLSGKDKWNIMTVTFSSDGEFYADFDYTQEFENDVDYFQKWKQKYLK